MKFVVYRAEFIRNLEEYVQPAYVNKGVSFSCGYSGIFNGSKFTSFHEINSINNAQGQVLISKRNNEGEIEGISSIYSTGVSHSRLHWKLPVIVDGSKPLYIRTVHEHGDYYSEDYARKMSASSEVIKEKVVENFKIDSFL